MGYSPPTMPNASKNVKDPPFNATGNGSTEDHVALQAAISDGGIMYVPNGTYIVGATLLVDANPITMVLAPGAVIKAKNSLNLDMVSIGCSDVTIRGGTFDGNSANQTSGSVITIHAAGVSEANENITIDGVKIINAEDRAVYVTALGAGATVKSVRVMDCDIIGAGEEGIFFATRTGGTVSKVWASANRVSNTGRHGIIASGVSEVQITENKLTDIGTASFAHGIAIDGNGGTNPCNRFIVADNYVYNCYDGGIEVADTAHDAIIQGNYVELCGTGASATNKYGIYFGGFLASSHRALIQGNIIRFCEEEGIKIDALTAQRAAAVNIIGNVCEENGKQGIWMRRATNGTVTGNNCFNNGSTAAGSQTEAGIYLGDCQNTVVSGNSCWTNNGDQFYGIYEEVNGLFNVIGNNLVRGSAIEGVTSLSPNSDIRDNDPEDTEPRMFMKRQWRIEEECTAVANFQGADVAIAGTGAALTTGVATADHPGVVTFSTGTLATGNAGLASIAATGIGTSIRLGGGRIRFGCWTGNAPTLSVAAQTYTIYAGLGDSTTAEPTDGVYFRYTHGTNSGKWQGVCRSNGTESVVNHTGTAVAVSTWYLLEWEINAAGNSVSFFLNGVSLGAAVTTNIPTAAGRETGLMPFNMRKSAGTTARTWSLDAYFYRGELTTTR